MLIQKEDNKNKSVIFKSVLTSEKFGKMLYETTRSESQREHLSKMTKAEFWNKTAVLHVNSRLFLEELGIIETSKGSLYFLIK